MTFSAAGMGGMTPTFGDGGGLRPGNPFAMGNAYTIAGPVLMLGDATAWLDTRGDLVLSGAGNPGLVDQFGTIAHAFGPDALEGCRTIACGGNKKRLKFGKRRFGL